MALLHLSLRDFAIVTELNLPLQSGFTTLTGETGAGKSILVDALQLILGGRGDSLWVREGQKRCDISAEFDLPEKLQAKMQEFGFETDENTLLIRRTIDAHGKSRAWVNGSPSTLTQIRELADGLVDIHGQHAWQSLTRPASMRDLLDAYAGADPQGLQKSWQQWQDARQKLLQAKTNQKELENERERLQWQIQELEKLAPQVDEWDALNRQHTRLGHAQSLIQTAHEVLLALDGENADNALSALARAQTGLQAHAAIEPQFQDLLQMLQSCEATIQDGVYSLRSYLRDGGPDPDELARIDERVSLWLSLARRFHRQPQDLPDLLQDWTSQLQGLEQATDLQQLQKQVDDSQQAYLQAARKLSAQRHQHAPHLAREVTAVVQQLGMPSSRFVIALNPLPEPGAHGLEDVEFQMAAHASNTPRPVARIASGGELSRLALAVAVTTSQLTSAATLVFDEVDAGIGGAVAITVGQLLRQLGADRQVLCVTHLAQVACNANQHLQVSKSVSSTGEYSQLHLLEGEERVREIARMLSGQADSETTMEHAREILQQSHTQVKAPAS